MQFPIEPGRMFSSSASSPDKICMKVIEFWSKALQWGISNGSVYEVSQYREKENYPFCSLSCIYTLGVNSFMLRAPHLSMDSLLCTRLTTWRSYWISDSVWSSVRFGSCHYGKWSFTAEQRSAVTLSALSVCIKRTHGTSPKHNIKGEVEQTGER